MAEKKKAEASVEGTQAEVIRYKGSQLLKMTKYKSTVAQVVIKADELYSFKEADELISNFMKKKG